MIESLLWLLILKITSTYNMLYLKSHPWYYINVVHLPCIVTIHCVPLRCHDSTYCLIIMYLLNADYFIIVLIAGEDFIPGWHNVTFFGNATQATVNISLRIDNIDEGTEYFMLYLYIPSAAYGLGVHQGDIIKAVAIIFRPST